MKEKVVLSALGPFYVQICRITEPGIVAATKSLVLLRTAQRKTSDSRDSGRI